MIVEIFTAKECKQHKEEMTKEHSITIFGTHTQQYMYNFVLCYSIKTIRGLNSIFGMFWFH